MINIGKFSREQQFFFIIGVIFLLDQVTKYLVVLYQPNWQVLPILRIVSWTNTGAGFGLLQGYNTLLIFVALAVLGYVFWIHRTIQDVSFYWLALIQAGILGNVVDRIFRGAVIDFLYFHINTLGWPAFNIADSALVIGVLLLILKR